MQLSFLSENLDTQLKNDFVPSLGRFEWVIPDRDLTPEDYFVIGFLFSSATEITPLSGLTSSTASRVDFEKQLGVLANTFNSQEPFKRQIDEQAYLPIIRSLRLRLVRNTNPLDAQPDAMDPPAPNPSSAEWLRRWLAEPSKSDFSADPSKASPQLAFTFKNGDGSLARAEVFDSDAGYFVLDDQFKDAKNSSSWFRAGTVNRARHYVMAKVPIRLMFSDSSSTHFVPIYASFAEVERQLDVVVTGVRRRATYLRDHLTVWCHDRQRTCTISAKRLTAPDGRYTLWFGDHQRAFGAETTVSAAFEMKTDLLVAPGDILITEKRRVNAGR